MKPSALRSVTAAQGNGRYSSLLRDTELGQHERVIFGARPVLLEAAGLAAVPRLHVDPEYQRVAVGLHRPQLGHVLSGLVILDLAVPQPGADKQRRIGLPLDIVVG